MSEVCLNLAGAIPIRWHSVASCRLNYLSELSWEVTYMLGVGELVLQFLNFVGELTLLLHLN